MSKVKIFTTSTCVYCHMLKEYLASKKVDFEEVNLDQQPEKVQAFIDTCGSMAVPCTHVVEPDGKEIQIIGFDRARIDQALGLS